MPTDPADDTRTDAERRAEHVAALRGVVLRAMGRPADLFRVAVLPLWGECYRVNVLTGPDAATAKVAQSFFVVTDGVGAIVRSAPAITRLY